MVNDNFHIINQIGLCESHRWFRAPTAWPTDRTVKGFKRWFEYQFHSVLIDLCEHPIIWEEL